MNQRTTIGQMRERIVLQQPTESRDVVGQVVRGWANVATVHASVVTLGTDEIVANRQVGLAISTRLIIRYRADVLAAGGKWQVLLRGVPHGIAGVRDPEDFRRRYLELTLAAVQ